MSEVNLNEILSKKEFDSLSPTTKKEIISVGEKIKNKSNIEAFKIIGEFYNTTLKNANYSASDKKALYLAITNSLDSKTKKQFDMLYESVLSKM